jgi:transglutaminase/protease-like cytokinesis protein 3
METGPSDTVAPQIMGVNRLAVFTGSSIAYRSGILVSDDTDPAPKLSVDSSQVNLSAPGTYPVIYTATDSAGNATSVETTITVSEAPTTYVDEELIKETADTLLAEIITDRMTREEQVNAVYDWIAGHCYYIAEFDKSDYMQAAYLMMTTNRGDCYGFYAVSRLLFDRMGLPNLTVSRLPNETRTSNHWWNMVSLDGGESWYHFDSTPHMTYPTRTCLVTDTFLNEFNLLMPNYYYFDHDSFPDTPAV